MRFVCGDVRGLMVSHKIDHGPAHRRYRALQQWRRLKICFREIFGIVRFSTFATLSAITRHPPRKRLMNDAFLMAPHYHHSKQTDFADRGCVVASSVQTHTQCPLSTSVLIGSTRA